MTTIYTHHHHHQQPDSDAAQEVCKSPSSAAAAMAAASMRSERVRVHWSVPLIFHGLTTLSLLPLKAVKVMTGICKTLTEGNPGISMEMGELFCSGCGNGAQNLGQDYWITKMDLP